MSGSEGIPTQGGGTWISAPLSNPSEFVSSVDGESFNQLLFNPTLIGAVIPIPGTSIVNVLDFGARGDGTTDDTAAIQAVLNTYAGKAIVFVPDTGSSFMVKPLAIPAGTDFLIHGTLKLLPVTGASVANDLLSLINVSNISIRGHGTIDGNSAAQALNGVGSVGSYNSSNIRIEGITIQNAYNWNLNVVASSNVRVDRVSLVGGQNANEFASGCDNCWMLNSYIDGPSDDDGFAFYGGVTNSGIIGCVITGAFVSGISVYADAGQPVMCANIVVANNIVHHNDTGGIEVRTDGSPAVAGVAHSGITITGNRCYANNNLGNHLFADIWCSHGNDVMITGNDLSGSGSGSNQTSGVFVGVASHHVNITGNIIWNEGQGSTIGAGVYIQNASDVLVEANQIHDDQSPHTMAYGVDGDAGVRNAIMNNQFGDLGDVAIHCSLRSDTVVVGPTLGGFNEQWTVYGPGISYALAGHAIAFQWNGTALDFSVDGNAEQTIVQSTDLHQIFFTYVPGLTLSVTVDTSPLGRVLTDTYAAGVPVAVGGLAFGAAHIPVNAVNDAAAATAGVAVGGVYRNGSIMMVRVS